VSRSVLLSKQACPASIPEENVVENGLQCWSTTTRRNLTNRRNASRRIQPRIRHWSHSHSSRLYWKPANLHPDCSGPFNHYESTANATYRTGSEIDAVAMVTTGGVHTSTRGLQKSQHPLIWWLGHDVSSIDNRQTSGALHVEQRAVYECKRLGEGKLCNTTHCERINWCPTLADIREVLERHFSAKQHLVNSIWRTHKGDLERAMRKQRPTMDITRCNQRQVWAQVDKVNSQSLQWATDNAAQLYNLHCFESDAEHLEFSDSLLADNQYLFPVAEHVEGGVCGSNPM